MRITQARVDMPRDSSHSESQEDLNIARGPYDAGRLEEALVYGTLAPDNSEICELIGSIVKRTKQDLGPIERSGNGKH